MTPRDRFLELCEGNATDEALLDALLAVVDERIDERLKQPREELDALTKALWGKSK